MTAFQQAKLYLSAHVHLAKDALHIYVALILFFGSMLIFGWRAGQWKPWLVVLAAALLGEAWDIYDTLRYERIVYWAANWKDIWNTLFWPTAIVLLARFTPVFRKGDRGRCPDTRSGLPPERR
jgi:hypothetical protein